ncbi:lysine--tRNA ligase [Elysia marginata]|uniref:Lysine--tRNA ligase n=1 Tax=Elysia marginata TaxID=1093978 RepID=A0AAV4GN96_9GAST|nr:lysine--tRNA ligase [Elysia marginata]
MQLLSEQQIVRREKLTQLKKWGIDPYPAACYPVDSNSESIREAFEEGKSVTIAGRLMSRRIQGKSSFAELQDDKGRIQLYFNRDEICLNEDKNLYNEVYKKLLDIGDIIGIEGSLFTTQVGEKTILVKKFTLLSKSLRPLPLPKKDPNGKIYDEFNDPEQRYRQRYLDLIVNPKVKKTFLTRTKITNSIRTFFNNKGYLEVETPILQAIPGGATARPFVTHHNALNIPLYLRIANELYLKRLIVGGFKGVYEFAKDFRNEGMDRTHNPEFTVMELYVAYKDYQWMMSLTENLLEFIAKKIHGKTQIPFQGKMINFKAPYERISIYDIIEKYTGFDINDNNEAELKKVCNALGIEVNDTMGKGKLVDEIFGSCCEKQIIQPTFVIDYPKEMSPLTKTHRDNPKLTERFELIVNGKEIANAYSELNDPIDQRLRFEEQLKLSEKGDDEAMFIDHDFLRALEYGMPPTSGIGIGIDRLVMLMTDNLSIQEVLFFPQMRPETLNSKTMGLSEDAQDILKIISYSKNKRVELNKVKTDAKLSNKKWDKTIKELSGKYLVKVSKVGENLFMETT